MKAVVCQEPNELTVEEIDRPAAAPHEALVHIQQIKVCGTDLHAFKGKQPFFTYPRILGHELAGEIESIPDGNHGLKKRRSGCGSALHRVWPVYRLQGR